MLKKLRIVLAQLNLQVGDIEGNLKKSIAAAEKSRDEYSADVIVFPELSMTGYPPEDLLLRKDFVTAASQAVREFQERVQGIYAVIGHPHTSPQGLLNTCSVVYNGAILARYQKQHLPNYSVFDEYRYFVPGNTTCVIPIHGIPVGIIICEDLWFPNAVESAANQGARLILSLNASPFEVDKQQRREAILSKRAKSANIPILYANYVGGQDEIVFDGGSMAVDAQGKLCQLAGFFQEKLFPVDIDISSTNATVAMGPIPSLSKEEKIYQALVLGTRDYIQKNNFSGALIGVSGGIDSALTLAIAVDAIGKENVTAVIMPSRYSADISLKDANTLIKNLGVKHETISIEPLFKQFLETLPSPLADITQQNLQARCRGMILMALSNQTGKIVLTTSNRSELAVGYATLYGDMAGGFAVLKDIPKTLVYQLAHYRNEHNTVIPQRILERAPTAELAPNQKDEDTLPPYAILDLILEAYLDREESFADIISQNFDPETVKKVINLIHKSEYKRRQAPIGVRINNKAFGRDRRYPVSNGFKN